MEKAFERDGLKVYLKKINVMDSGLKEEIIKSEVDPHVKCGKGVMENSVLCAKCVKGAW